MENRCNAKLWVIRRLKKLGASDGDLLDVYCNQIRSIVEFAVPLWNHSINGENVSHIERIQKSALHIILGDGYRSYTNALKQSGLEKLSKRRRNLCLSFARKAVKHKKFSHWFKLNTKVTSTRTKQSKFCPAYSRTVRFQKCPICSLTELLNAYFAKKSS